MNNIERKTFVEGNSGIKTGPKRHIRLVFAQRNIMGATTRTNKLGSLACDGRIEEWTNIEP